MATTIIEEFDAVSISNASIQFIKNGTQTPGKPFGCIGKLEGETELKEIIKKCAGVEVKKTTKPQKMTISVSGHIPVAVVRDLFGLSNDGLKAGVYSYGADSKGLPFVFTADVVDEFEDVVKHIAFTNCASSVGLKISLENGADEVAEMELEFTAMADVNRKFYYEAFADEITDQTLLTKWHSEFKPSLVTGTQAVLKTDK